MMNNKINSLAFVNKIHEYLDHSMDENEVSDFVKSIQSDPDLNQILNQERNIRTILKNKIQRSSVDNQLIDDIKQKLFPS